jgi:two-component system, sensor histidine kinase and response regulator
MNDKNPAPLPGIDMVDALTRLGGNRALLERVYVDFCRQYADAAGELGRLAASGALSDAAAMAHAVKGVAGNIGAKRIYAVARDLEAAFLAGGDGQALLGAFAAALDELAPAAPPAPVMPTGGPTRVDREKFTATAESLRRLLQARDLDAEDQFAALRALCPDGKLRTPLAALASAIDALDYQAALDQLAAVERAALGASA